MIPYKGKITLEKTIKYIVDETSYHSKSILQEFDFSQFSLRLDEELLSEILIKFSSANINANNLSYILHFCEALSLNIVNKENKKLLLELTDLYIKNEDNFPPLESFDKLFNCFNDKKIGIEYLRYILSKDLQNKSKLNIFIDQYLIKARQYYVDDRALLTSVISLLDSIEDSDLMFADSKDLSNIIEKKLTNDKKSNGVYDIDQFTLEELDRKIGEFELFSNSLQSLIELTDQQIEELKLQTKSSQDDLKDVKIKTLKELKTEANKILKNFNASYLELLNKEKESIVHEKDILLADIESEIQKKKMELEALASSVGQRIAIELGRIRSLSDHSMSQIQEFVTNNEEIQKMLNNARNDDALLRKIAQIQITSPEQINSETAGVVTPIVGVPSLIIPKPERVLNEKINYYFDKSIPFKDRFGELMAKKTQDIEENGAIYHEKFDDLVTMVIENDVPYMFGPSGCGKTFMIIKQMSKLFGIDVVTNGYIMYETDILGFNDAKGQYVPSNFYRCYKFGDMVFLDELDNSIASSTIILNSFIGKDENSSYTFPGGDKIKRHPNFRIVAAGNTRGNGRTVSHNTRQKLDESVMQRLTPIEIDYDNRIEKKILENYPDWYNFAINFRNALKQVKITGSDGPNYHGTITTRDIETIKNYKENNSFSDDKIIEYQVIENKETDYLNEIITQMEVLENNGEFTNGGLKLLERFKVLSKGRNY